MPLREAATSGWLKGGALLRADGPLIEADGPLIEGALQGCEWSTAESLSATVGSEGMRGICDTRTAPSTPL